MYNHTHILASGQLVQHLKYNQQSVLFACKYALYYCHRVLTHLQLTNISHHITYHRISSHHIITYHITYHHITYHHITSHIITSITYHHITYHHVTYHHVTYHHITYHHISHHITYHHITYHHISSHHILSHHISSHHITYRIMYEGKSFVSESHNAEPKNWNRKRRRSLRATWYVFYFSAVCYRSVLGKVSKINYSYSVEHNTDFFNSKRAFTCLLNVSPCIWAIIRHVNTKIF